MHSYVKMILNENTGTGDLIMKYYFAPMEGITGYIYRNAYHKHFNEIDVYFTPFITPTQNHKLSSREINDILPEHNQGLSLIPQILTNKGEDFIWTAKELSQYGYQEVNLNLGCPSKTVVSKKKGSGFLAEPERLNYFLDEICSSLDMEISVKTRLGKDSPEEFYRLLEIFNQYPIKELIIHPRIQKDFYRNQVNLNLFREAESLSKIPLCYNGDLFTKDSYVEFCDAFPLINRVMLGRGLVANPGLAGELRGGVIVDKNKLKAFHDEVLAGYEQTISGDRNVLFKMKEIWSYMISRFENSDKEAKQIRKAQILSDYLPVVEQLFSRDG